MAEDTIKSPFVILRETSSAALAENWNDLKGNFDFPCGYVTITIKSSVAAIFSVKGSKNEDGTGYHEIGTMAFSGSDTDHVSFANSYRYISVSTATSVTSRVEIIGKM